MIPKAYIAQWRDHAPWLQSEQVEQDLILSRILIELFSDPYLRQNLAFRGGTALHKLLTTSLPTPR
jgi:predicted nucleotidyltransferase component of viral defense system